MTAAPFDQLAATYDDLWTTTRAGAEQRAKVWRRVDPLFRPGERLLDVGCGTGVDAVHYEARGLRVHATDASQAMVEIARGRGGFRVSRVLAEEIATLGEMFDGALSNFGALNCVPDLTGVARQFAMVIRPGGYLAICTIGRFCAAETVRYAARAQFRKAMRRLRGVAPSTLGVTVYYPTVQQLRRVFRPHFELRRWWGIDHVPAFRWAADHRLLLFQRVSC